MIKIHHQMGRQQQAVTAAAKWTGERRKRTLGRNGDVTQLGGSKSIKQLLCVEGGGHADDASWRRKGLCVSVEQAKSCEKERGSESERINRLLAKALQ